MGFIKMRCRDFVCHLLVVIISSIFSIALFNFFIDPFDVFNSPKNKFNINKPNVDKNQRLSKIPALKLNKEHIDAIWIGSSKTGWNSNEEYEKSILKLNIKNLTLNNASFYESITMAKNALQIHPEIKRIYFGIDFSMLKQVEPTNSLMPITHTHIQKEELFPLLISLDTTTNSFNTFLKNCKKKSKEKDNLKNKKIYHKFEQSIKNYYNESYKNYQLDEQKIEDLKEFIKWCNYHEVDVIFFTTTMHMGERLLIDYTNNLDNFYKFKNELANIQPYYDFALVNKYTTEKVTPEIKYFKDPIHTTVLGRTKITNKLAGKNEDFGTLITKNNVKNHNSKDNALFLKYKAENKDLIDNIKKWSK